MTARWFFEVHAIQRMAEMEVPRAEVLEALTDPETKYPSPERKYGPGYEVFTRGRLAVVAKPSEMAVITILWNRREGR